jgi:hypothetical protein
MIAAWYLIERPLGIVFSAVDGRSLTSRAFALGVGRRRLSACLPATRLKSRSLEKL